MKKIVLLSLVFIISVGFLTSCAAKPSSKDKITFVLDWTPNTNHTGLYVAIDNGYFAEQNITVDVIQPGDNSSDTIVASGKADYGFSYQESVTMARAKDIPLVSLAAVIQHNTSAFASPISKNIKTPKDFEGKKYAGWGSPVETAVLSALMKKYNADFSKLDILTTGATDFFATTEKNADFAWIYYGWDGIAAKIKNKPLNYIFLKDEDKSLDYYTPVIITNEKTVIEKKDLTKRVMLALEKGYKYTIKNPDKSASILLKNVPELDKQLVTQSQIWLSPKYQDDATYWGEQKAEVWNSYAKWLYDRKLIEKLPDMSKAFTDEFLSKSVN